MVFCSNEQARIQPKNLSKSDNFLFADKKLLQEWREYQVNKKKNKNGCS
jgi:hypothetical protein